MDRTGEEMTHPLLVDFVNGDPISPEEFIMLRKMRKPRDADYVVESPHVKDKCLQCQEFYPIELAVIVEWKPMVIVCPDCCESYVPA